MSDRELVAAAIRASGLSARRFAVERLRVNERTIKRWLSGESTIRSKITRARVQRLAREATRK
jgi:hypothetical protein